MMIKINKIFKNQSKMQVLIEMMWVLKGVKCMKKCLESIQVNDQVCPNCKTWLMILEKIKVLRLKSISSIPMI